MRAIHKVARSLFSQKQIPPPDTVRQEIELEKYLKKKNGNKREQYRKKRPEVDESKLPSYMRSTVSSKKKQSDTMVGYVARPVI